MKIMANNQCRHAGAFESGGTRHPPLFIAGCPRHYNNRRTISSCYAYLKAVKLSWASTCFFIVNQIKRWMPACAGMTVSMFASTKLNSFKALAIICLALITTGCVPDHWPERWVQMARPSSKSETPINQQWCYRSLAQIDCYDKPRADAADRLVAPPPPLPPAKKSLPQRRNSKNAAMSSSTTDETVPPPIRLHGQPPMPALQQ